LRDGYGKGICGHMQGSTEAGEVPGLSY
jgi:hypothetical protein